MNISTDTRIPFPRSLVYATYRDKLVEIVPYLTNVRSLEIKSRYQEGEILHSIYEWHGGGEIPHLARAILSENMLSWTEHDRWNETDFTVAWKIETHAFTEAVFCSGKNHFLEDGQTTVIESRGRLVIDPKHIKGFPHFLVGQVSHLVEDVLGQKIQPNLLQMSEGVRLYLEKEENRQKGEETI